MLESETRLNDLPQVQNPDGGDQGAPLPQAAKMALPEVRRHPDAEAKKVLRKSAGGRAPLLETSRVLPGSRPPQKCQNRSRERFCVSSN